jgi:hypothetical protein
MACASAPEARVGSSVATAATRMATDLCRQAIRDMDGRFLVSGIGKLVVPTDAVNVAATSATSLR